MGDHTNIIEADDKSANKKTRLRSAAYPSYSIDSCIEFTGKVDKDFTSVVYTPAEAISKSIGVSGGTFLMQLSTCVQYKLLELKSGSGYKPTDKFKKIKSPLPSENVNDTLIECFQSPPLYRKLITEFKDKPLPSEMGLANILERNYGIYGNASNIASKVFLKNIDKLGLKTSDNILRLDPIYIPFEETQEDEDSQTKKNVVGNQQNNQLILPPTKPKEEKPNDSKTKEIPVFLQGNNREAKVVLPIDFTDDDLKKVIKVLNGYLP